MGLILGRRVGQSIDLYVKPGTDPVALAEALANGISIRLHKADPDGTEAWIDISAPDEIGIYRRELLINKPEPA